MLAFFLLAGTLPAAATQIPQPVSPGALSTVAGTEARCPTFSWAGVPEARSYELAVFRVSNTPAVEPVLVTRASVPGDARAFTPQVGQCLERGERYAWSVAAAAAAPEELLWSAPYLFEVQAAPTLEELEQAMATLERYREHGLGNAPALAHRAPQPATDSPPRQVRTRSPRTPLAPDGLLPGARTAPTSGVTRITSAAAPALGTPSLSVSANIALGAASHVFKYDAASMDDVVFLWDDTVGNTALGRNALSSASGFASSNTALGREALQNTTGTSAGDASSNTAVGDRALRANTTGYGGTASGAFALRANTSGVHNTASGAFALYSNTTGQSNTATGASALVFTTTGSRNTASGAFALRYNTTGDRNTALGYRAGYFNTTGDDSVFLNNTGSGDSGPTIRIGTQGTQVSAYIAGIRDATTYFNDAMPVYVDSAGQLGTTPSSRNLKQDIHDLGPLAERLLDLRPVAFRYRQHAEADPDTALQFGLIAEEVAEVFPELVVYDDEGRPQTVKYHLLSSLLLGELQRVRSEHDAELQRLGARLAALESRSAPPARAPNR